MASVFDFSPVFARNMNKAFLPYVLVLPILLLSFDSSGMILGQFGKV